MATISFNRSAHQRINPNLHVGKEKPLAADLSEQLNINKAIVALYDAKRTTDHTEMMVKLTEAFRLVRNIVNTNK